MKRILGPILAALLLAGPAMAAEPTAEKKAEAEAFAVNNALSALYHEFGHLFVDQFDLPILGREEDVADAIATLLLLKQDTEASYYISYDTVDGYLMSSELYGENLPDNVDFSDEHGLDVQRAYQMTCLLVGGDPDNFGELATEVGLDDERQETCLGEYDSASRGWERMMEDHLRGAKLEGAKLTVSYDPAPGKYQPMLDLLKRDRVLEQVAETVVKEFVLVKPAALRGMLCEEENAFYDPETGEVTLCYEYVKFYYDLIVDPENAGADFAAAE